MAKRQRRHRGVGAFIGVFVLFVFLVSVDAFADIRAVVSDKLYGGRPVLDAIVLVTIDDASIQRLGRWPWDRDVFAEVLKKVENAKVVGVDVSFFEASANDAALQGQLAAMQNVVLAAEVNGGQLYAPIFENAFGYVNFKADNDGVIRKVDARLQEGVVPFAFAIFQKGWNSAFVPEKKEYLINFADNGAFRMQNVADVLQGKEDFGGKVVLIGATAPNLHDAYFVPTSTGSAMPGVEIHANILQNVIADNFLRQEGKGWMLLGILCAGVLGMFVLSRINVLAAAGIGIGVFIAYIFLSVVLFAKWNYVMDLVFFPAALVVFTGTGTGVRYWEQKRHNMFIRDAFGKYLSKDLVREIVEHEDELKLGGEKRTITVFFSDVRGFTTMSEKLQPEELVHLLNAYLTAMTKIILKHKGTVDKFIGDAIMAFWNAPLPEEQHAQRACEAAIEQVRQLRMLRGQWQREGLPLIEIGCGMHTGEAIVGNMGSEDRFDYTAMGDTVNLGSRLEGLTKTYGVDIILSEKTYALVKEQFTCRKLDVVRVKGKNIPVVIYELLVDDKEEFRVAYEHALELYLQAKFAEALQAFENAAKSKTQDKSCHLFMERCKIYMQHPPGKEWDGAFAFTEK